MTLIARITRLFKADLHGILDSLEEPEEVIKQAIRDMEEDLAAQESRLAGLHAVLQRLEREAQETTAAMQEIEQHIDTCFAAENELLAKNLIRQRLAIARRASYWPSDRGVINSSRSFSIAARFHSIVDVGVPW